MALPIYNVYGFPGGHHNKEAAERTNAIVEAVVQKATNKGDLYAAIVGDQEFPALGELLRGQGWTELGAHPALVGWGAPRPDLLRCWPRGHQAGLHLGGRLPDDHGAHLLRRR